MSGRRQNYLVRMKKNVHFRRKKYFGRNGNWMTIFGELTMGSRRNVVAEVLRFK